MDGPTEWVRPVTAAVAGLAYGLLSGLLVWRWLGRRSYRYDYELDLPIRRIGWTPVVTVVGCVLTALGTARTGPYPGLLLVAAVPLLVALAAIDLDTRRLPDLLTLPGSAAALLVLFVMSLGSGDWHLVTSGALGGLALAAFYLANVLIGDLVGSVSAMGLGDVKLALLLGLLLAPLSWTHLVLATMLAFVTAGVQAVVMIARGRATRHSHLAFGPHMALGAGLLMWAPGISRLLGGTA